MSTTYIIGSLYGRQVPPIRTTRFKTRHVAAGRRAIIINHKHRQVSRCGRWVRCRQRNGRPQRINRFLFQGVVKGFACMGVLGVGGAVGFSCKLESDNGGGVVRSRVNAAQSQWVDREPYRLWYWCAARNLGAQGPDDCHREVLMHFSSTQRPASYDGGTAMWVIIEQHGQ